MEFHGFNHFPKNVQPDCQYYNYSMAILQLILILWYASHAFDWCRDPLAVALQRKLDLAEEENIRLRDEIHGLECELDEEWNRNDKLNDVIDELRSVLNLKKSDHSDSDSSDSPRKRRREG